MESLSAFSNHVPISSLDLLHLYLMTLYPSLRFPHALKNPHCSHTKKQQTHVPEWLSPVELASHVMKCFEMIIKTLHLLLSSKGLWPIPVHIPRKHVYWEHHLTNSVYLPVPCRQQGELYKIVVYWLQLSLQHYCYHGQSPIIFPLSSYECILSFATDPECSWELFFQYSHTTHLLCYLHWLPENAYNG